MRSVEPEKAAAAVAAVFPEQERATPTSFWFPRPSAELPARGVLYLDEADLSDEQFAAVSRGADAVGDPEFYLSYMDRYADGDKVQDFLLSVRDIDGYRASVDPAPLDHALVSPTSKWGVYALHDGIAVVAGGENFIATVYADLSAPMEQAIAFMRDTLAMNHPRSEAWAVALFENALGSEVARGVLAKARRTG